MAGEEMAKGKMCCVFAGKGAGEDGHREIFHICASHVERENVRKIMTQPEHLF
jgi:hypothetical protein